MSLEDRVETLKAKHASLETKIEQESTRPLPDAVVLAELKRRKLRLKEEIHRISH